MYSTRLAIWAIAALPLTACQLSEPSHPGGTVVEAHATDTAGDALSRRWSHRDSPSHLGHDFDRTFDALPTRGQAEQLPWAGNYWPTYQDGINYRWEPNALSPAEKYGRAFGIDGIADRVSAENGVDSLRGRWDACTMDSECSDAYDADYGSGWTCAKRAGEDNGYCAQTWWGICHAWAPAAIMEPEPQQAVTHNGITFEVQDLKALVSFMYDDGVSTDFMSLRCNDVLSDDDLDANGDPEAQACWDTNPGSFHIVVANLMGRRGESFVIDKTIDSEVWNQPVMAYELRTQREISRDEAQRLAFPSGDHVAFDNNTDTFIYVEMSLDWLGESPASVNRYFGENNWRYANEERYAYVLELDDGEIIGGEWVGRSKTRHPDFVWVPTAKRATSAGGITWAHVKSLLDASIR